MVQEGGTDWSSSKWGHPISGVTLPLIGALQSLTLLVLIFVAPPFAQSDGQVRVGTSPTVWATSPGVTPRPLWLPISTRPRTSGTSRGVVVQRAT